MESYSIGSYILALAVSLAVAGSNGLHLNSTACNSNSIIYDSVLPVTLAEGQSFGSQWPCDFDFSTAEKGAGVNLVFGSPDDSVFNKQATNVSISFYTYKHSGLVLLNTYEYSNWSKMEEPANFYLSTDRLLVKVNGEWSPYWATTFNLSLADFVCKTTTPDPAKDAFSLAGGVFALALGSTVALTLLLVAFWCCCCKTNETHEQVMARRRRRMIDQLAKDGYSVTRNYGSTSATSPLLRDDQFGEIFTHPEQRASAPPQGASGYDPPPSYDSVRPSARQHGYGPVAPSAPRPPSVPEAILIHIEDDATPVIAPTAAASQRDLMEFGTSGEHPHSRTPDLLTD